jgi:hypothetical protein
MYNNIWVKERDSRKCGRRVEGHEKEEIQLWVED